MATTATLEQTLPARQEKAIAALMSCTSVLKAAEQAGVGERTLHSWLRQPAFAAAYRSARRESFSHAIAMTQRYAGHAVQALAKVMTEPSAPWTARVQAAVAILRFGREGIELEDLQQRIEALEMAAGTPHPLAFHAGATGNSEIEKSVATATVKAAEMADTAIDAEWERSDRGPNSTVSGPGAPQPPEPPEG